MHDNHTPALIVASTATTQVGKECAQHINHHLITSSIT